MDKYGRAIREIREKNNDTREELAKKLKLSESALASGGGNFLFIVVKCLLGDLLKRADLTQVELAESAS